MSESDRGAAEPSRELAVAVNGLRIALDELPVSAGGEAVAEAIRELGGHPGSLLSEPTGLGALTLAIREGSGAIREHSKSVHRLAAAVEGMRD